MKLKKKVNQTLKTVNSTRAKKRQFQIPGTAFKSLSVEPRDYDLLSLGRTWIPDFSR